MRCLKFLGKNSIGKLPHFDYLGYHKHWKSVPCSKPYEIQCNLLCRIGCSWFGRTCLSGGPAENAMGASWRI
jgi:hypothetical protein